MINIKKIFGNFECENCPLSWEDRSYEGECDDCGCLVYKDLYEGGKPICHLPMWIKRAIAEVKQRKIDKAIANQYDGIFEWYEEQQKKEQAMMSAINDVLKERGIFEREIFLCFRSEEQEKYYPIESDSPYGNGYFDASYGEISEIINKYEENIEKQGE